MKTDNGRISACAPAGLPSFTKRERSAFTLIELLVVIGIIALLISILLPVISKVRMRGHVADTQNFISQLSAGITAYHSDQRGYPGPLPWNQVYTAGTSGLTAPTINVVSAATGFDTNLNTAQITGSENLVLGLLGGLSINTTTLAIQYDPSQVGSGPSNLNAANPKRYPPYVDPNNLDWQGHTPTPPPNTTPPKTGHYYDEATWGSDSNNPAGATDTIIPEFVDRFPDGMPILYLRARVGQTIILPTAAGYGKANNSVITDGTNVARPGQYDLSQIIAYTGQGAGGYIGTGRTLKASDYVNPPNAFPAHGLATVNTSAILDKSQTGYSYPYDAFPYFQSPNSPNTPRQKDGFILISAGPDRVYGTQDDIDSFGDVLP